MKDLRAFTNLCINQYVLEIAKERAKDTLSAVEISQSLYRKGQTLLNEVVCACDSGDEAQHFIGVFEEAIRQISIGRLGNESEINRILREVGYLNGR